MYEDGAVEAEALLRAIDSVRLLFIRAIAPEMSRVVNLISTAEFRQMEQTFEAAWKAHVRTFIGECDFKSHEVNWSDPAPSIHGPSLGPAASARGVLVHVSKSVERVIYRDIPSA
jgi:hypothetical protein